MIKSNQMRKVAIPPQDYGSHYFLPHHAVVKESSTTTRVRPVFNASARNATGQALCKNCREIKHIKLNVLKTSNTDTDMETHFHQYEKKQNQKQSKIHTLRMKQLDVDEAKYKKLQRQYKYSIAAAQKKAWRDFCENIEGGKEAARLSRLLEGRTTSWIEAIQKPGGNMPTRKKNACSYCWTQTSTDLREWARGRGQTDLPIGLLRDRGKWRKMWIMEIKVMMITLMIIAIVISQDIKTHDEYLQGYSYKLLKHYHYMHFFCEHIRILKIHMIQFYQRADISIQHYLKILH
ncbi:unnamed protein product [Trichogramma brassicae]|uniref:Uncharacterized protein n=1 Tax=Trichogramma brassicae TaxID=86971 RepID=A0A6H5IP55_9HYME|nr:unnamed protein product [Trichogramma brassicae]